MSVKAEIQSLAPTAIIELFELDTTMFNGGTVFRFHAGTNELQLNVWWQGYEYTPLPIEASGFDISAKGALPKPRLKVANIEGLFSALVSEMDDLVGAKITRKRTFAKYLDAVNFADGNPLADPNQHMTDDIWFVDRKVAENRYVIEWELASSFDLQGVMLPFRQVIQNSCQWRYRSAECGYTGSYFDKYDIATADQTKDFCSKTLKGCRVRFGEQPTPFGGFPGAHRYD